MVSIGTTNYCLTCDATFTIGDIGTKVHSCKACTEKDYIKEVKDEFLYKDKLVVDPIVDKDIMGLNEMKLYSDTKQVWWIRLIKWALKYI